MPAPPYRIFIGWDPAQLRAWNVAKLSLNAHAAGKVDVDRIAKPTLTAKGLYTRPTHVLEHGYWDEISQAPMSTGHAIARFLVPYLCGYKGWALFTDGDVLFRRDVSALFALADPTKAVQVVQHQHEPTDAVKMTGEQQTTYARKNWSSVMLLHCGHPANQALTVELVNTVPGRDLHRFYWLDDDLIGALPATFNHLVGVSAPDDDPAIVHYTEGLPDLSGYEHCEYSDEWYVVAKHAGYDLARPPKLEAKSA